MLECYSDTDWAGCPRTRKSTSGGCLMLGRHVLKTWSSTQANISLSSGEAEFYGVVKAAGIALGQQSLLRDLGYAVPVRVWTDSSAAMGICQRQGLGKLRHIQTNTLWIQEQVRTKTIELRKVKGEVNPADLFTKYLPSSDKILQLVNLFGCEYRAGRPVSAPLLRSNTIKSPGQEELESAAAKVLEDVVEDDIDQEAHDPDVLPHDYPPDDLARLFPRAGVADTED